MLAVPVLAACADAGTITPESPEQTPEVAGDEVLATRGWDSGFRPLVIIRSDVADDGTLAADVGAYTCYDPDDCWKKCAKANRKGYSTICSCTPLHQDGGFPLECSSREIADDEYGDGDDPTGCGGGGGGPADGDTILADCRGNDPFMVTLSCSASVTRGGRVNCTARTRNRRGPVAYSFLFEPDGGGSKLRGGALFEPLPDVALDSVKSPSGSSATWSGTAVHGGTVRVMATDSTGPAYAVADFHVEERSGWKIRNKGFSEGANLTMRLWRVPGRLRGKNSDGWSPNSSANPIDILKGSSSVATVSDGPNRGYAYVTSESYYVRRYRHVNQRLLQGGPQEIPDTVNGQEVFLSHWQYLANLGLSGQELLDGTRAHEGRGRHGAKGHQGQIEAALTVDACGDVSGIVEPLVAHGFAQAERLRKRMEGAADSAFAMAAGHHHVYGNIAAPGAPIAYWEPGHLPYDSVAFDRWMPWDNPYFRSPGCDWHSF